MNPECEVCGRKEGDEVDICGFPDGIPLGPIERCETCRRLVCPDCLNEVVCCFAEADDHNSEPDWSPPGWSKSAEQLRSGAVRYVRI